MEKKKEGNKTLIEKFEKVKLALMKICDECHVSFDEKYPEFNVVFNSKSPEHEIRSLTTKAESITRSLISKFYLDNWSYIINKTFSDSQKVSMFSLMETLYERDPANLYLTFTDNCDILVGLESDDLKIETLKYLEDFSSNKSIEDVTNNYGILFYSNYKDTVTDAFCKGFKHNNKVNEEYVSAYFGGVNYEEALDKQM